MSSSASSRSSGAWWSATTTSPRVPRGDHRLRRRRLRPALRPQHFGDRHAATRDVLEASRDVIARRTSRPAGASTLTQQLARNLFAETVGFRIGDISLERKIKEAIVALQIEKRYTKREILTLYANQVLFGHGTYGVEAAARSTSASPRRT